MVARIAADLVDRIRSSPSPNEPSSARSPTGVSVLAPCLLALVGVGPLIAAKIVAEVADVRRFKHKDAFARHNGTAPLPVWSGNRERHRLSRTGNRQLNAAIHRIAITQALRHPDARAFLETAASPWATPQPKPYEPSNDDSPTSSTEPSSPTQNRPTRPISPTPLDIGADDTALDVTDHTTRQT